MVFEIHRANAAERAICTFKAHFLAGLSSCDPNFPISEWDQLLDQAEMTLNLLRTSRCNPKLSAYAYIHGAHDFNKEPLAPPGTKVIVHQKPQVRKSWGYHGKVGWYVGPAKQHYRCYRVFMPDTASEIVTDTLKFLSHKLPFPTTTVEDHLKLAVDKIKTLLSSDFLHTTPTQQHKQLQLRDAFIQVAAILNNDLAPKTPIPSTREPLFPSVISKYGPPLYTVPLPRVERKLLYPNPPTCRHPSMSRPRIATSITSGHTNQKQQWRLNHIYDTNGTKMNIDKLITMPNTKDIWL